VNDFYEYNFSTKRWSLIEPNTGHPPPSPRDRHVAVVYRNSFFVFGGFDGNSRVNDFYEYSFDVNVRCQSRPIR
jgi:leucine-zipper-like transcriptional regulator 1